jgi:hypothetical protein
VRRGQQVDQQAAARFLGYDLGLTRGSGGVQVRRGQQVDQQAAARHLEFDMGLARRRGSGRVQVRRRTAGCSSPPRMRPETHHGARLGIGEEGTAGKACYLGHSMGIPSGSDRVQVSKKTSGSGHDLGLTSGSGRG